jgi:hypothetical protein
LQRFNRPVSGSAHIVGEASGPASNTTIAGTFGAYRLRYGTNVDALALKSQYTVQLQGFDIEQARIEADTGHVCHACRSSSSARDRGNRLAEAARVR